MPPSAGNAREHPIQAVTQRFKVLGRFADFRFVGNHNQIKTVFGAKGTGNGLE
jgi:hypothetical protein